jgi:hypothetical protein
VCGRVTERPISFSPSPQRPDEITASPEYTPQLELWDKLTEDVGGQTVTAQVADLILEERRNKIIDSVFVPCGAAHPARPSAAHSQGEDGTEKQDG